MKSSKMIEELLILHDIYRILQIQVFHGSLHYVRLYDSEDELMRISSNLTTTYLNQLSDKNRSISIKLRVLQDNVNSSPEIRYIPVSGPT
jgi:hypothetical protein